MGKILGRASKQPYLPAEYYRLRSAKSRCIMNEGAAYHPAANGPRQATRFAKVLAYVAGRQPPKQTRTNRYGSGLNDLAQSFFKLSTHLYQFSQGLPQLVKLLIARPPAPL